MAKVKSEIYVFPNLGHEIPLKHNYTIGTWFTEKTVQKKSQ